MKFVRSSAFYVINELPFFGLILLIKTALRDNFMKIGLFLREKKT